MKKTKNKKRLLKIVSTFNGVLAVVFFILTVGCVFNSKSQKTLAVSPPAIKKTDSSLENPQSYQELLTEIETQRTALATKYQQARTPAEKTKIVASARQTATQFIYNNIFPSWYGTEWDFYGTTEAPGKGKIACGYFVSTVLRDTGWRVQRVKMAQQASENIILSLTTNSYVKRFRNTPINDFVKALEQSGEGLYVVGLDIHVGFIVNTGDEVFFIHSSYAEPYKVVKEKAIDSTILASSKYRVLGKISADDSFIIKWLTKQEIITKTK
jgi:hypothetical protein